MLSLYLMTDLQPLGPCFDCAAEIHVVLVCDRRLVLGDDERHLRKYDAALVLGAPLVLLWPVNPECHQKYLTEV